MNIFAVAIMLVKPSGRLRPPRPANRRLKPNDIVPGAPFQNPTGA
jgi:hypothetical protein